MQKLHLVGFTTDQKGLILSARRGARSGSFNLAVDDALVAAVADFGARRAEETEAQADADDHVETSPRVESLLPVREVQARLRQGRTIPDVAKAAGVEPAWVERFAAPVFAEQAQVVRKVRSTPLRRARLGPSSQAIGDAVRTNLAARGVVRSPEEFDSAWSTRQMANGRWAVRFGFRYRGKERVLRFDLDEASSEVVAFDAASAQIGYTVPAGGSGAPTPAPAPVRANSRPTAKRATVTTGFRPEPVVKKAVSRPAKERERASAAMRRAVSKRAADDERAALRKAKARRDDAARRERAQRAEEARKVRERAASERAKVAAARTKAATAKKKEAARAKQKADRQRADQARRAEAALAAAEKAAKAARTAKKKAPQKASKPKAPPKRAPATAKATKASKPTPPKRVTPVTPTAPKRPAVKLPSKAPRAPAPVKPAPLVRPSFRPGLVEPVARRPLDRPVRTRPLRAD